MERVTKTENGKVYTVDVIDGCEVSRTYSEAEWGAKQNPPHPAAKGAKLAEDAAAKDAAAKDAAAKDAAAKDAKLAEEVEARRSKGNFGTKGK